MRSSAAYLRLPARFRQGRTRKVVRSTAWLSVRCLGMQTTLYGATVALRPATADDIPKLAEIRTKPEVYQRWRGGEDLVASVTDDVNDPDQHTLVIEYRGRVVGAIQWGEEREPDYRHASIDIYLDPAVHGRGLGTDSVRTLAIMRRYERGPDGTWHDGLLMDLLADELNEPGPGES
jgi:aminoglycoside 6'-N-acetyltransferase